MNKFSKTLEALLFMLASMLCFALMSIFIRLLAGEIASTQMVFVRNSISLVLVCAFACMLKKGLPRFTTHRLSGHFGRAMMGLLAMQLWFYSLTVMPVTLATALSFTTPIFATIFAIIFLKERAGWRRWTALIVSFIGVLLILNPDIQHMDNNVWIVLVASAAMAVSGIFVKSLSRTESPETVVFYMALFMTPLSFPQALYHWQPLVSHQWIYLAAIGLLSTSAQLMMVRAYQRAEVVVLMPLDFTRLIFVSFFAYLWFGEILEGHAWVGAGVIVASSAYIAHRDSRLRKNSNPIETLS